MDSQLLRSCLPFNPALCFIRKSVTKKKNTALLFFLPIWLSAAILVLDTLILRNTVFTSPVENIRITTGAKGNKVCKLTLSIPSKYAYPIFETRPVSMDFCRSLKKGEPVTAYQSKIYERWINIKSENSSFHFGDQWYIFDILFLLVSAVFTYLFYNRIEAKHLKHPRFALSLIIIWSIFYIANVFT